MKLGELKNVLWSGRGSIQFAIVYDRKSGTVLEEGCSVDYAVENYAEKEVYRLQAENDNIVIVITA